MIADAPRLYTPEEAAEILNGHAAPFNARAGDVTPGGRRAAAHRREIPFRLWRGKIRFTDKDLRAAVATTAVPALPAADSIPMPRSRPALGGRSRRGSPGTPANVSSSPAGTTSRRQLTAKAARPGRTQAPGDPPTRIKDLAPRWRPSADQAPHPHSGGH
ncbi:MAG TPA: hypothetical protein VMV92_27450 [Streptosporangiaceae bacterium]|nr:hypothetical protein [Streptosporangiaceae bacterium]